MEILIWIGIGVIAGFAVVAGFFVRREFIVRRGGTIELSIRLSTLVDGRGWAPGYARFAGDELRWYRMFSLAFRPRRILPRRGMTVQGRRLPEGNERLVLPEGWVVLRCLVPRGSVEIAMPQATVTGFLSWIEAAPPGAVSPRLAS
jgi:Protein of unknown function (DUF2550)